MSLKLQAAIFTLTETTQFNNTVLLNALVQAIIGETMIANNWQVNKRIFI